MALKIRLRPAASIKVQVKPKLPVSVAGSNGIDADLSGGTITVTPAYDNQSAISSLAAGDRDNTFALVYNSDDDTYKRLGMDVLLASISAGLDTTLVSIAALTPTTDQGIYFSATDTAAVYSLTSSGRALAGLTGAADKVPYFTGAGAAGTTDLTAAARSILDDTTVGAIATTLGLGTADSPQHAGVNVGHATDTTITRASAGVIAVEGSNVLMASNIGSTVQAYDAELAALASVTSAADKVPYFTGAGAAAVTDLTTAARTILDDASVGAIATTLGLGTADSPEFTGINVGHASDTTITRASAGVIAVEGSNVLMASGLGSITQAYDAELAALASVTSAADKMPYFTGSGTAATATVTSFARTILDDADAAAVRTTIGVGLGTGDLVAANNLSDLANAATARTNLAARDNVGNSAVSFFAHKNGTDQTGVLSATQTKITFGTEMWDTGSYYDAANSKWAPPAGTYRLTAQLYSTANMVDGSAFNLSIYKNGSLWKGGYHRIASNNDEMKVFSTLAQANGTDYFEVYVSIGGAGNKTISGLADYTWFCGEAV